MGNLTKTQSQELDTITDTEVIEVGKVILFNDEVHSFDDVIDQLILAINCSFSTASEMAFAVHNQGQCNVYEGTLESCLSVSAILEEIDLITEIKF